MEGDFEGEQKTTSTTTTTTTTEIDTRRSESITVPDFTFVRTPTGILMIVNVVSKIYFYCYLKNYFNILRNVCVLKMFQKVWL